MTTPYNWTDDEKQRFYEQYGFWPEQANFDASTLPGAPQPEFPLLPSRQPVGYENFDVTQHGQQEADKQRLFMAMTEAQQDSDLDSDYKKTVSLARLAQSLGANVTIPPPRRTNRSTADPVKGVAASASMEGFKKVLYESPPRTAAEAWALVKATNAGKAEIELLNKLFPKLDLGKIEPMFRYENGKIEKIFRHVNAPLGEERGAGFTFKLDAAKLERTGASERAQSELSILAEQANIMTQEDYNSFIENLTDDQKKALNTDPKVLNAVNKFVPDAVLKSAGKKVLWSKKDGKYVASYVDPAKKDFQDKLESGEFFETIEALDANKDFELTDFIVGLMDSPEFGDLTDPEKRVKVLAEALKAGVTATTPEILKAFDDAVDKTARKDRKYVLDVNTLNNKMNDFSDWDEFYKFIEGKNYSPQAVTEAVNKLQNRHGDTWRFTPVMVYNAEGDEKWVTSAALLQTAHDDKFVYTSYNEAPNRPIPKISKRYWTEPQPSQDFVSVLLDGENFIEVYTDQGKHNKIKGTQGEISTSVADFDSFSQRIEMIMAELAEGQPGTDLQAIRDLEKLKDDTGVIRESDVVMIRDSIGTYLDMLYRFRERLTGGPDRYLSPDERDQVALAALTTLSVLQNSMSRNIEKHKLAYEWDTKTTWSSKGKDRIDFFEVIPEAQYDKYKKRLDWKKQKYWTFQPDFSSASVNPRGTTATTGGYSTLLGN